MGLPNAGWPERSSLIHRWSLLYAWGGPFAAFFFIILCCLSITVPDHCKHFSRGVAMQYSVVAVTVTHSLSFIGPAILLKKGRCCFSLFMELEMYQHFILVRWGLTYASLICFCWWSYFSISPSLSTLFLLSESCLIFPLQVIRGSWTTSTKMAPTVPLDNVMASQGIPGEISMPSMSLQYASLSHPHTYDKYCLTVNRKCCCTPAGFPEMLPPS